MAVAAEQGGESSAPVLWVGTGSVSRDLHPRDQQKTCLLLGKSERCTKEQMFVRAKDPATRKGSFCLKFPRREFLPEPGSFLGHPELISTGGSCLQLCSCRESLEHRQGHWHRAVPQLEPTQAQGLRGKQDPPPSPAVGWRSRPLPRSPGPLLPSAAKLKAELPLAIIQSPLSPPLPALTPSNLLLICRGFVPERIFPEPPALHRLLY